MSFEVCNTQNKIYNDKRRTFLDESDLKEGEVFCSKCKGTGTADNNSNGYFDSTCDKCHGRGIVDWIENVVGKPEPMGNIASSSFSYVNTGPGVVTVNLPKANIACSTFQYINNGNEWIKI